MSLPHAVGRFRFLRSAPARFAFAALAWLVLISALHAWRNGERSAGRVVRLGHMPVLSNLACPILEEASKGSDLRYSAIKFSSFSEMGEALRGGTIDAAFIIAPLPLVMRSQGVKVKIVSIGNRHESTLVARKELGIGRGQVRLLAGRTVAVPLRYSGHHVALLRLLRRNQMAQDAVRIVEMQPPDMAAALRNGSLDAYFVGEPFAARSVRAGLATVVEYVEEDWPGFLCNVVAVREDWIRKEPEVVRALVAGIVRANLWARDHRVEAATVASKYWGHEVDLLRYAMDTPPGRMIFDRPVPAWADIRELYAELVLAGLAAPSSTGVAADATDESLASSAPTGGITDDIRSVLVQPGR